MKSNETGVLQTSDLYFSSPSPVAQRLYYYPISAGHFFCEKNYHLIRDTYNSLLITHILRGSFTFLLAGREYTARQGETVLLDCYHPHEYYTKDSFESVWIHISGVNCLELYRELVKNEGNILRCSDPAHVEELMLRLFHTIAGEDKPSEIVMSLRLYELVAELSNPMHRSSINNKSYEESIGHVKKYIAEHISEPLSVGELAERIHMSKSHFSRIFRRQTGFSPYDYVLILRLNRAKDYLQKTELSISEIAYAVGFNSESNFIYFFTTNTGLSPKKFRRLTF